MRTRLHDFADAHNVSGKVEADHILLAGAYLMAAVFHLEIALSIAYMMAATLAFFARKVA